MPKTLVLGGGLVGPVAAMALAQAGQGPVTLLERRPRPAATPYEPGRSVQVVLSARGWATLDRLGLRDRVRDLCMPLTGRMAHLPDGNRFEPYGRHHERIWCVDRHSLNRLLLTAAEATPEVRIYYRSTVEAVDPRVPAVRVVGETEWRRCGLVVGCDGVHSPARAALTARGARQDVHVLELGYVELTVGRPGSGHWPLTREHFHYWPRGQRMLGVFPSRGGGMTGSLFLPLRGADDTFEQIRTGTDARALFRRLFPDVLPHLAGLEAEFDRHPVNRITTTRCSRWAWRDTFVLLGDACHAMAPFMGQGMNCGFEDVCTLVDALIAIPDRANALAAYENQRRPQAEAITDISERHYQHLAAPLRAPTPRQLLRRRLEDRLYRELAEHFAPLYEQCAFTLRPYQHILHAQQQLESMVDHLLSRHGPDITEVDSHELARLVRDTTTPRT